MLVTFKLFCITPCNIFSDKRFLKAASTKAPKAPKEAASVGVANPARIEPKTKPIKAIGGIRLERILPTTPGDFLP